MRLFRASALAALLCLAVTGLAVTGLAATAAVSPAQAAGTHYLRGYTQALLDENFPDLNLTVTEVTASDAITLTGPHCIDASERARVHSFFAGRPHVENVRWRLPCAVSGSSETSPPTPAPEDHSVQALPTTKIFRPLLADPRAARFSGYYQYHENHGKSFSAGAPSFGETFGLLRSHFRNHPYQIGITAAVFALFNLDTKSHDLVNADYMVGIPVTYRTGNFSYRARLYHISSHLGDEFILNNPNVHRVNLSYEVTDLLVSWSRDGVRLYGGGGAVIESEPDLDPGLVEFGGEYRYPHLFGPADFVAGADFKLAQSQDFGLNQSYIMGLAFHSEDHTVRTVLQYYTGFSPNGQFDTEQVRYFGFGLQFEL